MLTRSSKAPYGALSASIIFPPFGLSARLFAHEDALFGSPARPAVPGILMRGLVICTLDLYR